MSICEIVLFGIEAVLVYANETHLNNHLEAAACAYKSKVDVAACPRMILSTADPMVELSEERLHAFIPLIFGLESSKLQ